MYDFSSPNLEVHWLKTCLDKTYIVLPEISFITLAKLWIRIHTESIHIVLSVYRLIDRLIEFDIGLWVRLAIHECFILECDIFIGSHVDTHFLRSRRTDRRRYNPDVHFMYLYTTHFVVIIVYKFSTMFTDMASVWKVMAVVQVLGREQPRIWMDWLWEI